MTRAELFNSFIEFRKGTIDYEQVVETVDAYSSALIAQSKCSTPLELLQQMANKEKEAAGSAKELSVMAKHDNRWRYISTVIKFIKELPPMA